MCLPATVLNSHSFACQFLWPLSLYFYTLQWRGHQLSVYRVQSGVKEMSFFLEMDEFRFLHRWKAGPFHLAGAVMTTRVTLFEQMAQWHYRFLPLFALTGLYLPLNLTLYSLSFPPDCLTSYQRKTIDLSIPYRIFPSRNHIICKKNSLRSCLIKTYSFLFLIRPPDGL